MRLFRKTCPLAAALVVVLCLSSGASAHQPYARPIAEFWIPDGGKLTVEKLYGDGVVRPDPVRGQVKDDRGAVVALTLVGLDATSYCPELRRCWILIFDQRSVRPTIWRLQPNDINWTAPIRRITWPEDDDQPAPVGFVVEEDGALQLYGMLYRFYAPRQPAMMAFIAWCGLLYAYRLRRLVRRATEETGIRRMVGAFYWPWQALMLLLCVLAFSLGVWFPLASPMLGDLPVSVFAANLASAILARRTVEFGWRRLRGALRRRGPPTSPTVP